MVPLGLAAVVPKTLSFCCTVKMITWPLAELEFFPPPLAYASDRWSSCLFHHVVAQGLDWHSAANSIRIGNWRLLASHGRDDSIDVVRLCQALTASDKTQSSFPGEYPKASRLCNSHRWRQSPCILWNPTIRNPAVGLRLRSKWISFHPGTGNSHVWQLGELWWSRLFMRN